jgi:hypothetical protein
VRAGLLDGEDRVCEVGPGLGPDMGFEPGEDHPLERRKPDVAIALREEVVVLVPLDLVEAFELREVISARRPGKCDRTPDPEVMPDVGIVERDHVADLRKHPQQPGAAAA